MSQRANTVGGLSLFGCIAAYLSWSTWHSVAWALVHFICGGFYILYWVLTHS